MIEIISYQEIKGNNKDIVDMEFEKLTNDIKNKYNAEILSVDCEEEDEGGLYTKVAELKIIFNSFLDYIDFCLNYGADLDIVSPSKLKISSKEFGEALAYIIEFFKRFYEKYKIMFNVHIKEEEGMSINIEEYKNGIYDEDDIFALEEEGLIKVKAVFEGFGSSEEDVIKKILLSLSDNIVVNRIITKPLEKEGPYENAEFYGLIAVELFCKPFDIVEMAYKFLPVVISIENKFIEINGLELQDIGNDLGGAVFELTHATLINSK
ncbi:hypothetical protein [Methanothermococcus sp.]|uniref:hypothetical protein n=1 Tax=Methanothermococcus sp. TaxID=2614238 RepID=UPI0025FEC520|nr:hypothetical protein [Methanothermococcus sp.]